jgi:hypothetical protein
VDDVHSRDARQEAEVSGAPAGFQSP